ncbi:unnamed protein product, partial [marine sediment metagenome]
MDYHQPLPLPYQFDNIIGNRVVVVIRCRNGESRWNSLSRSVLTL